MFKVISAIFFIVLGVVANGEIQNVEPYNSATNNNSSLHPEEYINLNRQQYAKNIEDYDIEIRLFNQGYSSSLDTISIRHEMLINTLVQTDKKLNPLEVLSDLSQKCVTKYRASIPTVPATNKKINECVNTALLQLNNIMINNQNTKTNLETYYKNTFERDIASCKRTYNTLPLNYTMCAINVVDAANTYTINNQKTFANQMDTAQCSSQASIKKALDCSYTVENETISGIAEAKTLITKCLEGQDDCKQCKNNYSCSQVHYMRRSEVDYSSRTMANPFYGRTDIKNCLMLQIQ